MSTRPPDDPAGLPSTPPPPARPPDPRQAVDPRYQPARHRELPGRNGLATAALVCGVAGSVLILASIGLYLASPGGDGGSLADLGLLAVIVGFVLGWVARGQIRRRPRPGRGHAVAGVVIGFCWLACGVVGAVVALGGG